MAYIAIRIDESAAEMLNRYAAEKGLTKSQAIISALKNNKDEADQLLELLDAQYDKQNEPAVEAIDTTEWVAGVAPECCCDFYYNYFYNHKSEPCEHWKRVRWTDRNGNSKVNWYNDLINKFEFADDWKIAMKEYI